MTKKYSIVFNIFILFFFIIFFNSCINNSWNKKLSNESGVAGANENNLKDNDPLPANKNQKKKRKKSNIDLKQTNFKCTICIIDGLGPCTKTNNLKEALKFSKNIYTKTLSRSNNVVDIEKDTENLISQIKQEKNKVILIGHGYGGILVLNTLNKYKKEGHIKCAIVCNVPFKGFKKQAEYLKKVDLVNVGRNIPKRITRKILIKIIKSSIFDYDMQGLSKLDGEMVSKVANTLDASLKIPLLVVANEKPNTDFVQYEEKEQIKMITKEYVVGDTLDFGPIKTTITMNMIVQYMGFIQKTLNEFLRDVPLLSENISGHAINDLIIPTKDQQWNFKNKNVEQKVFKNVIYKHNLSLFLKNKGNKDSFSCNKVIQYIVGFIKKSIYKKTI